MSIVIKEYLDDKGTLYYQVVNEENYDATVKLLNKEEMDAVYQYKDKVRTEEYVKSLIEIMCDSGALSDEEEYLLTRDDEIINAVVLEIIENEDVYQNMVMQMIQKQLDDRISDRCY